MHNSKSIIKIVIFCIILTFCSSILTFLLYPWSSLNRHFKVYHDFDKNIDFLILGNSLENNGINPDLFSSNFNCTAYKFTPQGSYPESLYYILLDVLNTHNVKKLLLGWDIIQNFQDPPYIYPHSEELYREFLPDSYGNPKLAYLTIKNIMNQRYTSTFFKWSSFPENIMEIPAVLESKRQKDFTTSILSVANKEKPSTIEFPIDFDRVVYERKYKPIIQTTDKEYILKIKQLCEEKYIDLYVISCTIPDCIQKSIPQMSDFIKISSEFMKENNITYINASDSINFPNASYDYNFHDCFGHYNAWYQDIYSQQICDYIKNLEE